MKYLYPLSLLLFLASCQKEEKKEIDRTKTDWAFYKFEGDVKSVTTHSWLVNDKLEKLKTQHEDMSMHDGDMAFGEDGMLLSEKFNINGAPFEENTYKGREKKQQTIQYINQTPGIKTEYGWDKKGNNTSITRRNADNTQIDRIEMKYQGDKVAQKTTLSGQNNPTDKITYIYDSKGNMIEQDMFMASEYVQFKSIYKYDKQNRKISEISYNKESKKLFETIFTYEGKNPVKKITYDGKGETEYSEDFTYDKKGNELSRLTYEKFDKSTTLDNYSYDNNGNKISWKVTKNDKLFMTATFTYDKYKNTTLISVLDATGKEVDKREYVYEYDATGNWIKKMTKIKGVPQYIAERQIAYYGEE